MTALAWAAPFLVLGSCVSIAWSILSGHRAACLRRTVAFRATRTALRVLIAVLSVSPVRRAVARVRWAWRCRKPPAPPGIEVDTLLEWERAELITILRGRKKTARPEKSRT